MNYKKQPYTKHLIISTTLFTIMLLILLLVPNSPINITEITNIISNKTPEEKLKDFLLDHGYNKETGFRKDYYYLKTSNLNLVAMSGYEFWTDTWILYYMDDDIYVNIQFPVRYNFGIITIRQNQQQSIATLYENGNYECTGNTFLCQQDWSSIALHERETFELVLKSAGITKEDLA